MYTQQGPDHPHKGRSGCRTQQLQRGTWMSLTRKEFRLIDNPLSLNQCIIATKQSILMDTR